MNATPEKLEWQREGSTVYTLMHDRWVKGEEQFRNRIWFGVYVDKDAGVSREDAAAFVAKACGAHDKVVEVLKAVRDLIKEDRHIPLFLVEMALLEAGEPV